MNKKSTYLFYTFIALFSILIIQFVYLSMCVDAEIQKRKESFVSVVGLPDLAISSESYEMRHRTLSSVFDIYSNDATLREYTLSSFTISAANIENKKSSNE